MARINFNGFNDMDMKAEDIETKAIKKTALIILGTNSIEETIDWVISKMEVKSELKTKELEDEINTINKNALKELDSLQSEINRLKEVSMHALMYYYQNSKEHNFNTSVIKVIEDYLSQNKQ